MCDFVAFAEGLGFSLYGYQKRLIDLYEREPRVVVCHFRQGGFSTANALYITWKAIQGKHRIALCSPNHAMRCDTVRLIRSFLEKLDVDYLRDSSKILLPECGSEIFGRHTDNLIGQRFDIVLVDEASYCKPLQYLDCGKIIVSSSLSENKTWFDEIILGDPSFSVYNACYLEHPKYSNPEWVLETKRNIGEKRFDWQLACKIQSPWQLQFEDLTIGVTPKSKMPDATPIGGQFRLVSRYAIDVPEGVRKIVLKNAVSGEEWQMLGNVTTEGRFIVIDSKPLPGF